MIYVFHVISSDPAAFSLFKIFQIIDPLSAEDAGRES